MPIHIFIEATSHIPGSLRNKFLSFGLLTPPSIKPPYHPPTPSHFPASFSVPFLHSLVLSTPSALTSILFSFIVNCHPLSVCAKLLLLGFFSASTSVWRTVPAILLATRLWFCLLWRFFLCQMLGWKSRASLSVNPTLSDDQAIVLELRSEPFRPGTFFAFLTYASASRIFL